MYIVYDNSTIGRIRGWGWEWGGGGGLHTDTLASIRRSFIPWKLYADDQPTRALVCSCVRRQSISPSWLRLWQRWYSSTTTGSTLVCRASRADDVDSMGVGDIEISWDNVRSTKKKFKSGRTDKNFNFLLFYFGRYRKDYRCFVNFFREDLSNEK